MEPEPSEEEAAAEGSLEQGQDEPSVLGNSTDVKVWCAVTPTGSSQQVQTPRRGIIWSRSQATLLRIASCSSSFLLLLL